LRSGILFETDLLLAIHTQPNNRLLTRDQVFIVLMSDILKLQRTWSHTLSRSALPMSNPSSKGTKSISCCHEI
jgi:hypothetical protein